MAKQGTDRSEADNLLRSILTRNLGERTRLLAEVTASRFDSATDAGRAVLADLGSAEERLLRVMDLIGESPRDVYAEARLGKIAEAIAAVDVSPVVM